MKTQVNKFAVKKVRFPQFFLVFDLTQSTPIFLAESCIHAKFNFFFRQKTQAPMPGSATDFPAMYRQGLSGYCCEESQRRWWDPDRSQVASYPIRIPRR
jgi:hypothetical protein